jgi:hypothetical protein
MTSVQASSTGPHNPSPPATQLHPAQTPNRPTQAHPTTTSSETSNPSTSASSGSSTAPTMDKSHPLYGISKEGLIALDAAKSLPYSRHHSNIEDIIKLANKKSVKDFKADNRKESNAVQVRHVLSS